ncbi:MAG: CpXC domain-containing protein [Deltaproteobacteria bacterium]|nr:CpXC domain-containing protein [Deltaproteobacteria bacterium]MCW5806980.1 CpXC domain-containing protein [Deltaproteobacteria bacterium]
MISGTLRVRCPACGVEQDARLVQSIDAQKDPEAVRQLLAGELNLLACACGKRTRLAARLLYTDASASFAVQACPGGEEAMAAGAAAFRTSGATGTHRLVPSQDALVEKVRILEAGLDDRVVEVAKVLQLAALGGTELARVVLFDRVEGDRIVWVMLGDAEPEALATPLSAYERLAAQLAATPPPPELRVDRAWAFEIVKKLIAPVN